MKTRNLLIAVAIGAMTLGTSACSQIFPPYRVFVAEQDGKAKLAEAESSKQVQVQTSKSKADAAQYEADAEVTRATGLAKAISITGKALQDNPEYLRYLYVNNLAESKDQIIYVPTEAGLPILEAGRRGSPPAQ
jgi:regulator of protease activity HflC (stomatin/prohibitin superfamily)